MRSGHLDDFHLGHEAAQVGKERLRLGKGLFMGEQHPFIGDRDHIIVESAGRDRGLGLAGEEHAVGRQAMRARHRLTGFAMLARWERAAAFAIDKDLDPRPIMRSAEPHVVGGTLVAKGRGDRRMDAEGRVGKGQPQLRQWSQAIHDCDAAW